LALLAPVSCFRSWCVMSRTCGNRFLLADRGANPMAHTTDRKPVLRLTRRLPKEVEARIARDYEPHFNSDDHLMTAEEILRGAQGCDGLLVTPTDKCTPELIANLPQSVRIIATFSVGFDHVDVPAAKAKGLAVTNTPEVLTNA